MGFNTGLLGDPSPANAEMLISLAHIDFCVSLLFVCRCFYSQEDRSSSFKPLCRQVRQSALYKQVVKAKPAPPQGRPTLLLRACTIYALGGEWREPAVEDNLCVPVLRQAHTRTHAYVCNPMRSPGEDIPRKAGCRRERTKKRLQMEANIIAHAWLTLAIFLLSIHF
jgi:hypothetical protein